MANQGVKILIILLFGFLLFVGFLIVESYSVEEEGIEGLASIGNFISIFGFFDPQVFLGAFVSIEGCGDGVIQGDEGCDDGNVVSGDGCSDVCSVEVVTGPVHGGGSSGGGSTVRNPCENLESVLDRGRINLGLVPYLKNECFKFGIENRSCGVMMEGCYVVGGCGINLSKSNMIPCERILVEDLNESNGEDLENVLDKFDFEVPHPGPRRIIPPSNRAIYTYRALLWFVFIIIVVLILILLRILENEKNKEPWFIVKKKKKK